MSSTMNDENNDSYTDSYHSISTQNDSGYLTTSSPCTSSYLISPPRLSPSLVLYNPIDSPLSEHDIQSPKKSFLEKFSSQTDYENYINTRKYFDVLTQLYHRNTYHLIDHILKNLPNSDLTACLIVCKKWNFIIKNFSQRQQTKNVKRNLFNNDNNHQHTKTLINTPMQVITNKIEPKSIITEENKSSEENVSLTASTMTYRYGYLKYLHGPTVPKRCPLCSFVSIVDVNDQHGICTNPLCRNNFCQRCSAPYHPLSPCKITTGPIKSPWRQRARVSPIFSNKTRNNLRRLLLR